MKKISIVFLFILLYSDAKTQTVILNVDRTTEQRIPDKGPNLKKFTHVFIRAGILASKDEPGARIIYGPSVNLALGVRKKYKVSPVYSLGYEIAIEYIDYKLKQEKGKLIPDTVINNKSGRLDYSFLSLGFYNRFNFDPARGNYIGNFLDIGINGSWDYSIKSISKNKHSDGTVVKAITHNLPYTYNINAGLFARLGLSHGAIYCSYRLGKLFRDSYHLPDLPRIIVGLELGIF